MNESSHAVIRYADQEYQALFSANPEWEKLLLDAFPKESEITVTDQLSGYSGAFTWKIVTTRNDTKDGNMGEYVVKIGHYQSIEEEKGNHEHDVSGNRLYGDLVKPDGMYHAENSFWGALKFSLAGGQNTISLLSCLQKNSSYFEKILDLVFNLNHPRWAQKTPQQLTYRTYYDRLLPEHFRVQGTTIQSSSAYPIRSEWLRNELKSTSNYIEQTSPRYIHLQGFSIAQIKAGTTRELTLTPPKTPSEIGTFKIRVKYILDEDETLPLQRNQSVSLFATHPQTRYQLLKEYVKDPLRVTNVRKVTFRNSGLSYPNPIHYLEKLLDKTDNLYFGMIHGDLNLQNILVSIDEKQEQVVDHWVIDLANAALGPLLFDFQWLEVQVILWLFTKEIENAKGSSEKANSILSVLRALHNDDACPDQSLHNSYAILLSIRHCARKFLVKPNNWGEYYRGLIIALIGATRLKVKDMSPKAASVAFLYAATLLCWAEILSDRELSVISKELYPEGFLPKPPGPIPPPNPAPLVESEPVVIHTMRMQFSRRQLLMVVSVISTIGFCAIHWKDALAYWNNLEVLLGVISRKKIKLGVAIAGKGDGKQIGDQQWIGYDIAKEYFKTALLSRNFEIEPIEPDASSDNFSALKAFKELVDKKVLLIIGPTYSAQAETLFHGEKIKELFKSDQRYRDLFEDDEKKIDVLEQQLMQIPVIAPSNTADDIPTYSPYNLRVSASVKDYAGYAVTSMINEFPKIKNVALIWQEDKFTKDEAEAFRKEVVQNLTEKSIKVDRSYDFNNPEYDKLLRDITNETIDLVIISGRPTTGREILERLSTKGYSNHIIGGNGLNVPEIFNSQLADQMYIAQAYNYDHASPINNAFKAAYDRHMGKTWFDTVQELFGNLLADLNFSEKQTTTSTTNNTQLRYPSQLAAQMFTAFQVFVEAITNLDQKLLNEELTKLEDPNATPQRLRDAIIKQLLGHEFDTPLGWISFDDQGEIDQSVFCVAEISERQFKRIPRSGKNCNEPLQP